MNSIGCFFRPEPPHLHFSLSPAWPRSLVDPEIGLLGALQKLRREPAEDQEILALPLEDYLDQMGRHRDLVVAILQSEWRGTVLSDILDTWYGSGARGSGGRSWCTVLSFQFQVGHIILHAFIVIITGSTGLGLNILKNENATKTKK